MEHQEKRIYLLRHAKAEAYTSENDFTRALTLAGSGHASALGNKMSHIAISPDVVLTSSAKRAVDTASLVCQEIGVEIATLRVFDELYLADEAYYLGLIRKLETTTNSVLIIGHNPGLEMLVTLLAKVSPSKQNKPIIMYPATLFCLEFNSNWPELTPHSCDIQFHIDGKKL